MATGLRAVLDTNVLLAAQRSSQPGSPNVEILQRWRAGDFAVLYSADILAEYVEKLLEHDVPELEIEELIRRFARHGESVPIVFFHFRHYPVDPDDVMFLLCALNGSATHLVSYDDHLLSLHPFYIGDLIICEPLGFLAACRAP